MGNKQAFWLPVSFHSGEERERRAEEGETTQDFYSSQSWEGGSV